MGKLSVCPVILSHSIAEIQAQINKVKKVPEIKKVQVDIIDGDFADNATLPPFALSEIDFGNIKIDLHLMVREPVELLEEIDLLKQKVAVRGIIAQVERMSSQDEFIQLIKEMNCQIGLSLEVFTSLSAIEANSWEQINQIQLMSVEAGFQGQKIKETVYKKVDKCRKFINDHNYSVELLVDGGIKLDNAKKLVDYGVDELVIGSALWNSPNFNEAYQQFMKLA